MAEVSCPAAYFRLIPVPLAKLLLTALSVAYVMEPQGRKKPLLVNLDPNLLFMTVNTIYLVKTALNL